MARITFDTHDFITELSEAGIDAAHAKAISDGLKKANLEHVATKQDVALNREAIMALETRLTEESSNLRVEIHGVKGSLLQWFAGMLIGQAALVAALVKLL